MQDTGDAMSISSVIPEHPESDRLTKAKPTRKSRHTAAALTSKKTASASTSTPAEARATKRERGRMARAIALRQQFPAMQNIPDSITPSQRKMLILHHTQNAASTLQPTPSATNEDPANAGPAPLTQATKSKKEFTQEKQKKRADTLKEQYPDMKGIPPRIGQGRRKKLIAQYKARSSALAPAVTVPTSSSNAAAKGPRPKELPTQPRPPAHTSGTYPTRQFTRLHVIPADSSPATSDSRSQRPTSYKMAGLSEERLAEVARNLASGSNDDPVMVD